MEKRNIFHPIKALRKEQKMTQKQLVALLEEDDPDIRLTVRTLQSYENGSSKMPVRILIKLSMIFDCSTDYILGLSACRTVESDLIHQYTGLSDPAISSLHAHRNDTTIDTVNLLASRLGSGRIRDDLLTLLTAYLQRKEDSTIGDVYFNADGGGLIFFPGGASTDGMILHSITQKLIELRAKKKGSRKGSSK